MATVKELKDMVASLSAQIRELENDSFAPKNFVPILASIVIGVLLIQTYSPVKFLSVLFNVSDSYLRLIIISWPAAIIILGLVLFIKFEDSIGYFIKYRMTEAGPSGVRGDTRPPQINNTPVENAKNEVAISTYTLSITQDAANKIKLFERIYSIIYGSQLEMLLGLRSSSAGMATIEAAQYYLDALTKYPQNKNYKFVDYVDFMINSAGLVKLDGDFSSGKLLITPRGDEFLKYLTTENLTTNKPY